MLEQSDGITEKRCTLCKQVKPLDQFKSVVVAGYTSRCSLCRERGQRAHSKYVKKNRETINEYQAEYVKGRKREKAQPGNRICMRCLKELPQDLFPVGHDGRRARNCPECRRYFIDHSAGWRKRNPEKVTAQKERALQKQRERRKQCLEHYGLSCACCGEDIYEFLTVDHIDGGGGLHRAELHPGAIYGWLIKHGFPEGFQTLCWNCNWGKHLCGVCPHKNQQAPLSLENVIDEAPGYKSDVPLHEKLKL